MKTPDEIKRGAWCCTHNSGCDACPYRDISVGCRPARNADALALIYQLEAERDAAVDALTKIVQNHDESFCEYCDNWDRYTCPPSCWTYCERFKWRGVQKEETT